MGQSVRRSQIINIDMALFRFFLLVGQVFGKSLLESKSTQTGIAISPFASALAYTRSPTDFRRPAAVGPFRLHSSPFPFPLLPLFAQPLFPLSPLLAPVTPPQTLLSLLRFAKTAHFPYEDDDQMKSRPTHKYEVPYEGPLVSDHDPTKIGHFEESVHVHDNFAGLVKHLSDMLTADDGVLASFSKLFNTTATNDNIFMASDGTDTIDTTSDEDYSVDTVADTLDTLLTKVKSVNKLVETSLPNNQNELKSKVSSEQVATKLKSLEPTVFDGDVETKSGAEADELDVLFHDSVDPLEEVDNPVEGISLNTLNLIKLTDEDYMDNDIPV